MTHHLYPTFFFIIIVVPIIYLFLGLLKRDEPALYYMLLICFLCHLALMSIMVLDINSRFDPFVSRSHFFNDGETYTSNAWLISKTLKGELPRRSFFYTTPGIQYVLNETFNYAQNRQIPPADQYQVGVITYIYGVIFAAYGFMPGVINFINSIIHLAGGLTLFFLAKEVFNKKTGLIASFLYLFNPILFYYSTTKLKEPLYILAILMLLYCIIGLQKKRWVCAVPIGPLFLLITAIKPVFYYPLTAAGLIYMVYIGVIRYKKVLYFLVPAGAYICMAYSDRIVQKVHAIFRDGLYHNYAYTHAGGKVYSLLIFGDDYENYTLIQKMAVLVSGWYHMIAEPIIDKNLSGKFILFLPVKIVWVVLAVSAVLGIGMSFRQKPRETVLFVLILLSLGSVIALGSGNIGTVIRHRDVISPFIFMFGAYYLSTLFCGEEEAVKEINLQRIT